MPELWQIPCTQGPRAANDSGPRKASAIDLIVIHSAEASDSLGGDQSAEGVANYFARESTQASTHLAVDSDSCVRMLPDLVVPWGAKGANSDGLHIEICGRAKWATTTWLNTRNKKMLQRAAAKCAMWAWYYDIPLRWLSVPSLLSDRRGFTTHVDVNKAFEGGTHWDPGPGFPRTEFLAMVGRHHSNIIRIRGSR